jgi:hypothetical protein
MKSPGQFFLTDLLRIHLRIELADRERDLSLTGFYIRQLICHSIRRRFGNETDQVGNFFINFLQLALAGVKLSHFVLVATTQVFMISRTQCGDQFRIEDFLGQVVKNY